MATRTLVLQTTIAAAATVVGDTVRIGNATSLTVQSKFLYGAGGTATRVFIQTTIDGTNWFDIVNHDFTTAAATKVSTVTMFIAPAAQAFAPGDAALTTNTIIQGVLGDSIRVKYVSTGTYTGATSIAVYARFAT